MGRLRRGTAGLVFLALGCGEVSAPEAPAGLDGREQQEVEPVLPAPAPTPLEQLITALGGQAELDALEGLRIAGSGVRYIPNEGLRPGDDAIEANRFQRVVSLDFDADALRVDTSRDIEFLFPGSQMYSDIVRGNLGASTQPFFGMPLGALGSDKVASIRRQELLLTPHLLLRELTPAAVTELSDVTLDGTTHHRLVASVGPAPLTLFVNAATGELSKLETLELDFYQRDVPLEVFFSNWVPAAGALTFPRNLRVVRDGQTLFTEQVSELVANPAFAATTFAFPEGVSPAFDQALFDRGELSHQWYYLLDSIGLPFTGVDVSITPTNVASSSVLQLVGGSHHSFVVEQDEGLVLVDAPLHQDRADAIVDYLATRYLDKPIRFVVASHFHEDHVSGIREVLGRTKATLVVHESTEAFWRDLLNAPSTLRPDALSRAPFAVTILTVPEGGERTLPDAVHPVTLYHLDTAHAADMLLARDTLSNTVFVVDIYSPGNATQLGANDFAAALFLHDIPTTNLKIVGGHGAGVDDYAALQAQLL